MVTLLRCAELRELETRYADARPPLMERAGKAAAELALRLLGTRQARVLICAGPGNNGGDARVMARLLSRQGSLWSWWRPAMPCPAATTDWWSTACSASA
jgi:NAD(P)H-hydrate repair Nnr-like enzyme with NAD(P)H-hydrate epimerase domain